MANVVKVTTANAQAKASASTVKAQTVYVGGAGGRLAFSPFLNGETGTWMEWSDSEQQYVDTGVSALTSVGTLTAKFGDGSTESYSGTAVEWKIDAKKVGASDTNDMDSLTNLEIEALFQQVGL